MFQGLANTGHACSVAQSCLTLCNPMDGTAPGSSFHGISQARILQQLVLSSSGGLPGLGIKPASSVSPTLAGRFSTTVKLSSGSVQRFLSRKFLEKQICCCWIIIVSACGPHLSLFMYVDHWLTGRIKLPSYLDAHTSSFNNILSARLSVSGARGFEGTPSSSLYLWAPSQGPCVPRRFFHRNSLSGVR